MAKKKDLATNPQSTEPILVPPDKVEIIGVPCKYARFKHPVQVKKDTQPVNEFYLGAGNRHSVDSILYGEHTVIATVGGETLLIPHGNVVFARED